MLLSTIFVLDPCRFNKHGYSIEILSHICGFFQAFETAFHPLGKLMEGLVDVYRATYMGIGAHHPRLLTHAVAEVKSYVKRIYPLVRLVTSLKQFWTTPGVLCMK